MSENGIRSRVSKKFKATTNSNHNLPVAQNILNRDFTLDRWRLALYNWNSGFMWTKIIGLSMSERMTKELVINALNDAYPWAGKPTGVILQPDRGLQYCSHGYRNIVKKYGFTCSISRKVNYLDNAPMEWFWDNLKCEWIYGKHFKTRDEARAAVFEYIEIFYNIQRIYASNGYLTP
jgi:putative transposase